MPIKFTVKNIPWWIQLNEFGIIVMLLYILLNLVTIR